MLKSIAPYMFVLLCILVFVPAPVWGANAMGLYALTRVVDEPVDVEVEEAAEETVAPPVVFEKRPQYVEAFNEFLSQHKDYGKWTCKPRQQDGRQMFMVCNSNDRDFSSAERLIRKMIGYAMDKHDLDPMEDEVVLIVGTQLRQEKGSPTRRDVFVDRDLLAYNPATDAIERVQ